MFFREHASGKMIQGIIKNIDKSKFHVTVFCLKGCEGILTNQSHSF